MTVIATSIPQADVNGHVSKWQAVHHPIKFTVQRQDQAVQMKYKPTGYDVILKVSGTIPATVLVGQQIKYVSTNQTYTWTITSIVGNNIYTDGTITGTVYGGFVVYLDAYKNYFLKTVISKVDISNTYVKIGEMLTKADTNGIINLNVAKYLSTEAIYQNEFDYDEVNKAMPGEGGRYNIFFLEVYNGEEQNFQSITGVRYWTNSSKQVQEIYGANMGEYLPTLDDTRTNKAKFQSAFEKPTFFVGYPFSLNFIYSDNLLNLQVTREESRLDVNGNILSALSTDLDYTQRFFANRLMLAENYPSSVESVNVWLETGAVIPASEMEPEKTYSTGDLFDPLNPVEPTIKPSKSLR